MPSKHSVETEPDLSAGWLPMKLTSVSAIEPKSTDRTTRYKSAIRLVDKAQNLKLETQPPMRSVVTLYVSARAGCLGIAGLVHSIIPLDNAYNSG